MYKLLYTVTRAENDKLEKNVLQQMTQDSLGHSRNALVVLDKVLKADPESRLRIAKQKAEEENQVIELCRALLNGSPWNKISSILNGLKKQDPETIRRQVLGYCSAVLLKSNNTKAAHIIEEFWEPTYNIGFPGIVYMCFAVVADA
jgi:hypothetical protein